MGLASSARFNSAQTNGFYHLRPVSYVERTPMGAWWLKDEFGHVLDCVRISEVPRKSEKRYRCLSCPKES